MGDSGSTITLKSKLVATCCLIVFGIIILVVTMGLKTERIKVNGPVYQDIIRGKDLIADILLPPSTSSNPTWCFYRPRRKPMPQNFPCCRNA